MKKKPTMPETANDNQPEMMENEPQMGDLDFSADNVSEWDSDTSHLDEIVDPETIEQAKSEFDETSGLPLKEIFSKEEFFTDFFCQNLELAEALTGWVGLSVVVSDGRPEIGAKETSNTLYDQCLKFRFLHWAIKRDVTWIANVVPIMVFCKAKRAVVAGHVMPPEQSDLPKASNDNLEPMEETA